MVGVSSLTTMLRRRGIQGGSAPDTGLLIGRGGFGTVYRVDLRGEPIALKIIPLREACDDERTIRTESSITSLLARRGICPHLYFCELACDQGHPVAVIGLQLLDTTLYTSLMERARCTRDWAEDYIGLIRRMANLGVVAIDLKPTNVMYGANRMYLIDMGYTIHHTDPAFRRKRMELPEQSYRHILVVVMLSMFVLNSATFYAHLDRASFRSIVVYIRSYALEIRTGARDCLLYSCAVMRLLSAYLPSVTKPNAYLDSLLNIQNGHTERSHTLFRCGDSGCDPEYHLGHVVHGDTSRPIPLPREWYRLLPSTDQEGQPAMV
jgi:serine/threonine protein kinase